MSFIKKTSLYSLLAAHALFFVVGCAKDHQASVDPTANRPDTVARFTNPIKESVNNPYVYKKDGSYYFLKSGGNYIALTKLSKVEYLGSADSRTIFAYDPKDGTNNPLYNISSPEIHFLDGKWIIYFGADKDGLAGQKRIYAIENSSANPLNGNWTLKGKIFDANNDVMATDGTVLEFNNQRYLIWSGWATATQNSTTIKQNLYIAKMSTATTISGTRVQITDPSQSYETYTTTTNGVVTTNFVNQNPQVIKNPAGIPFIVFTAGNCSSDNVGLGLLTLRSGGDPMVAADWQKSTTAIFGGNGTDSFGPAFNGFFKSPNGAEDWMIYDTNKFPGSGCGSTRSAVMQKINWKPDGSPDLGVAVSPSLRQVRPAH